MGTNYDLQRKLTRRVHEVEREVAEQCVIRWTPEQIAQRFKDGYPEEILRKAHQSCYVGPNDQWLQL